MSEGSDRSLSMRCDACGKRLKFAARHLGKQIACPKCQHLLVLKSSDESSDSVKKSATDPLREIGIDRNDLDLFSDELAIAKESTRQNGSNKNPELQAVTPKETFEDVDEEFTLAPLESTTIRPKLTQLNGALDADMNEIGEVVDPFAEPATSPAKSSNKPAVSPGGVESKTRNDAVRTVSAKPREPSSGLEQPEFRYPCKVCGTHLYATAEEVGNTVRCPDCYTQFSIPSPPPGWAKQIAAKRIAKDATKSINKPANSGMLLNGIEVKKSVRDDSTSSNAELLLERAEKEIAKEGRKASDDLIDFDSMKWASKTFRFLFDPALMIIAISTGLMLGGAVAASQWIGDYFGGAASGDTSVDSVRSKAVYLSLVVLALPIFAATLANGIAVLESSANNSKSVTRWPIFNIGETLGEVTVVVASFLIAVLPGGLLLFFASAMNLNEDVATFFLLLIAWAVFPIVLLSMLDNQSIGEPISKEVIQSIQAKADAWAGMYLTTAIACLMLFFLYLFHGNHNWSVSVICGFVIPLSLFFIFHQYGTLAASISSIVESGHKDEDDEIEGAESAS